MTAGHRLHEYLDTLPGRPNVTGDCDLHLTPIEAGGTFDVLIFVDSRGYALENPGASWPRQLDRSLMERGLRTMRVVRPKDLTGLLTLFNFLAACPWRFTYAVCQVGLSDFTPKTDDALAELLVHKDAHFADEPMAVRALDRTLVMSRPDPTQPPTAGYKQTWSLDLDTPAFRAALIALLERHFRYCLLLGAVESDETARFARVRAKSFFDQVRHSNRFLRDLSDQSRAIHYLEPIKGWLTDTTTFLSDGAHYTEATHGRIFEVARSVVLANAVVT